MNRPRLIGIAVVSLAAVLIFGTLSYYVGVRREHHVDVDRRLYPLRGIDLSYHNGAVDFDRLAADSVDFIFVKISEGANWRDPQFATNFDGARSYGIPVGVYHFFRFDVSGLRQANNVLDALGGRQPDLPVAIDVEEWANAPDVATSQVIDHLTVMVERLQAADLPVLIYTNKNGYSRFVKGHLEDIPLWICSFTDPPLAGDWLLWQHSHQGRVAGVEGPVDINTFNSPAHSWQLFAQTQ